MRLGRRLYVMLRPNRLITALLCTSFGLFVLGPWLKQRAFQMALQSMDQSPGGTFKIYPSNVLLVDPPTVPKPTGKNIRIMSWTKDNITFWPDGLQAFDFCKLPDGKTCENVVDRSQYNTTEVVLLHGQVIDPQDMPKHRFAYQKWLFFEIETPPQTWIQQAPLDSIRSVFNLTSTITMDSHIPILERHRSCTINKYQWDKNIKAKVNHAAGKGHRVAWFVSHCDTQSRREQYAQELSKYIPVDIWGKCGNLSCGNKYDRGDCDKTIINKNYKFYLSFENSLCESYVTEKLWRLILQPISAIPIVMGTVDYKSMLPDKTYLDIKDFESPKHLAEFLLKLDGDDATFNEYIDKKNAVVCKHPGDKWFSEIRYQCQLCEYLHSHRNDVTQVSDVLDFWRLDRRCIKAKDYFRGSFDAVVDS